MRNALWAKFSKGRKKVSLIPFSTDGTAELIQKVQILCFMFVTF